MKIAAVGRAVVRDVACLMTLLGALQGLAAETESRPATSIWVGEKTGGTVSNVANWRDANGNAGVPTAEMLFSTNAAGVSVAGRIVVFDQPVSLSSNLSVGGPQGSFKTEDGGWNCVVWRASDSSDASVTNGVISSPKGLYVADRSGFVEGALRIESGRYVTGGGNGGQDAGLSVGRYGPGYFELKGGTFKANGDVKISNSGGGTVVIGSNEVSASPAVMDVDPGKWTYLSYDESSQPGMLTLRKSGVLKTSYITCKKPEGSSIVMDGGTLAKNGQNGSYTTLTPPKVPITLTANGGTFEMTSWGVIEANIVDADPDSGTKGTLIKKGAADLNFYGQKSYAGPTRIDEGRLIITANTQLGDLTIADGAQLAVNLARSTLGSKLDSSFKVRILREGATLTLTEGRALKDAIVCVEAEDYTNPVITQDKTGVWLEGTVAEGAAVARNEQTGICYRLLATAAEEVESGDTITLLKDIEVNADFACKAGLTLDLGGHTLTRVGMHVISFQGNTVLKNGTILTKERYPTGDATFLALSEGASLTIADVNVGNADGHELNSAIYLRKNSTVTISGGTWYVQSLLSSYWTSATVSVTGGRFHLHAWHSSSDGYRAATLRLAGGVYSLAPPRLSQDGTGVTADGFVVQHVPSDLAMPYHVVPQAKAPYPEAPYTDDWTFHYADQATAQAAVVATVGERSFTTIMDAVRVAKAGDTVTLVGDTVSLPEQVTIDKNITIEGNGHFVSVPQPFVAETGFVAEEFTQEYAAVFFIAKGADAVIRNVHVMGGGIVNAQSTNKACYGVRNEGTVFLDNVTVTRSNGAVWNNEDAYLYADNCRFVRNCRYCAGGLFNHGTAVLNRTSLSENRSLSTGGGGGAIENGGTLYLNNCVFCNNSSTEIGGAINNYAKGRAIALYMMNTTIVGNFTQFEKDVNDGDQGGGVGVRAHKNPGHFFSVNNLICNNYQLRTENPGLTLSDVRALHQEFSGVPTDMTNALYYTVYGSLTRQGKTSDGGSVLILDESNKGNVSTGVFKAYEETQRIYQNGIKSPLTITGAQLVAKDDASLNHELARYAPISKTGSAVLGKMGVYTYFDPSGWKTNDVRMSYAPVVGDVEIGSRTAAGEMVAFGGLPMADADHMVTNYYESATGRSFGVAGASGWLEEEKVYHTVKLAGEVVNGSVSGITLYGDAYEHGTEITLTATPGVARTFLGWFENDAGDEPVSTETVWTFQVLKDRILQPRFSDITPVVLNPIPKVHVTMADGQEAKRLYPITVTTAWMGEAFPGYAAEVDRFTTVAEKEAYLTRLLEGPDEASGLKKWQAYVLGNPSGKLWINSPQYKSHNGDQLRFEMNKLAPVAGSGFQIRYRLDKRLGAEETFVRDKVNATGAFDVDVATDPTGHYVIDLLFVPDGEATSEEYVTTVNTAGVLRVETRAERAALAVPWTKLRPTAASEDVAAVDLVKTTNLTTGDKLYVYDGASKMYKAWQLRDSGLWEALAVYRVADGYVDFNQAGTAPEASAVARGTGVWLQRQRTEGPVYLCGQVETASVTTPLAAGWNLVGSPTTAACDLSQLKPANGDRIVVPTAAEPKNMTHENGVWGYLKNETYTYGGMEFVRPKRITAEPVPAGTAFWYICPSTPREDAAIEWENGTKGR